LGLIMSPPVLLIVGAVVICAGAGYLAYEEIIKPAQRRRWEHLVPVEHRSPSPTPEKDVASHGTSTGVDRSGPSLPGTQMRSRRQPSHSHDAKPLVDISPTSPIEFEMTERLWQQIFPDPSPPPGLASFDADAPESSPLTSPSAVTTISDSFSDSPSLIEDRDNCAFINRSNASIITLSSNDTSRPSTPPGRISPAQSDYSLVSSARFSDAESVGNGYMSEGSWIDADSDDEGVTRTVARPMAHPLVSGVARPGSI